MKLSLNAAQQDAVTARDNILCCACPGSGKTRVLVEKVKHVFNEQPNARILLTTFSRDAAGEMSDRIKAALSELGQTRRMDQLLIGTFHSLAMRQIREAGFSRRILSKVEVNHIIYRALAQTKVNVAFEEAEAQIYRCKAEPDYRAAHPGVAMLTKAYDRELAERNACDFADLMLYANRQMARGELAPLEATHVFADEMQDIDAVQLQWLAFHLGGGRVACAVGDDDQSIYGFRAALGYQGMMAFKDEVGARIITLDVNYRCTPGILASAARLIEHNTHRVPKALHAARSGNRPPTVRLLTADESQPLEIIQRLDQICSKNPLPPTRSSEPYRFGVARGQAAVLARTNRQLDAIEHVFSAYRVPYLRTGSSFWELRPAQVFLSLLQSIHAKESTGIEVALRWAGLSDRNLHSMLDAYEGNLWHMLTAGSRLRVPSTPEASDLVHYGNHWASRLASDQSDYGITAVIQGVAGWMTAVASEQCGHQDLDGTTPRTGRKLRLRDLWVISAVQEALVDLRGPIPSRITVARLEGEQHIPRVILSTFHASKGLEWDHVFLVDVVAGSVPKAEPTAPLAEIEEERRAFYVAMTRARDSLTIFTRKEAKHVSEFLFDTGLVAMPTVAA